MANFNVRDPDPMAARFDVWAAGHGGRSPTLRHLIDTASVSDPPIDPAGARLGRRPLKLSIRLTPEDGLGLDREAQAMGLTRSAWAAAMVRHRLTSRPTFRRSDELALIAIQADVRRIGVNVNQIARALNTAVLEGRELDLELTYLDKLRTELRVHLSTMRQAFAGNAAYWGDAP